ncbi:MAG: radical SAM protein [Proteobacteria bacterium]|nr:radical SAM protein [Pseudomonadota bacterium]MBU4471475.1 radical SAM protein [Pseudomonadota bacterium]MCG2752481.1 radical SAM protein [Desulfobacteraceae bacterium]
MNIYDFLTTDNFRYWMEFIPKNREEYQKITQIAYNFKLNTKIPTTVHIEPTNYCNQKCYMCCHPDMKRKKQQIDEKIAFKAIDECAALGVYATHFFFFGEPFINKNTIEYMGYAKKKKIPLVSTTTNFTLVSDSDIEKLIDYQIDSIHVSFEGLNKERYKNIRGTDDFDTVKNNLMKLIRLKEEKKSLKPWIALTYVRTNETDDEIYRFIHEWNKKVNDIHISPQFDYLGRAPIRKYQKDVNSERILDRSEENRLPCRQLWLRLVVLSNGELVPCSQNIDGEVSIGNLNNTSIIEAWNSNNMLELRMSHLSNRIVNPVCKKCIDWDWSGKVDNRPQLMSALKK